MRERAVAVTLLLLADLAWGVSFPVVKRAVAEFPPLAFVAWRFGLAAALLAPWVLRRGRPTAAAWRAGAAMGALLGAAYALQTLSLRHTGATSGSVLTALYLAFTPLCAFVLVGRRTPPATLAWLAVALAGTALLAGAAPQGRLGDALAVACALAFALHLVATERHAPHHPTAALNLAQFTVAAAGCAALAVAGHGLPAPGDGGVAAALAFTVVACTVFGFGAQTWAQARLPASQVALLVSLEAPIGALASALLLGERLPPSGRVGVALVVGAGLACARAAASVQAAPARPPTRRPV